MTSLFATEEKVRSKKGTQTHDIMSQKIKISHCCCSCGWELKVCNKQPCVAKQQLKEEKQKEKKEVNETLKRNKQQDPVGPKNVPTSVISRLDQQIFCEELDPFVEQKEPWREGLLSTCPPLQHQKEEETRESNVSLNIKKKATAARLPQPGHEFSSSYLTLC